MEDSDDELPMISVDSFSQDSRSSTVMMPSAEEVAAERARERHLELELARMSEMEEVAAAAAGAGAGAGVTPARSESSGSEGEAALAAAVRALQVLAPAAPRRRAASAPAARAAAALLAALPPAAAAALAPYVAALQHDDKQHLQKYLTDKITHALRRLLIKDDGLHEEDMISITGIICAICLASPSMSIRQVLHRALRTMSEEEVQRLAMMIAIAMRGGGAADAMGAARALQRLSDAARAGPPPARRLADRLARYALVLLFHTDHQDCVIPAEPPPWPELCAAVAARCAGGGGAGGGGSGAAGAAPLLLALRLAARCGGGAAAAALPALAAAAQSSRVRRHPDYHKVAVAASTLQLLFRTPPGTT